MSNRYAGRLAAAGARVECHNTGNNSKHMEDISSVTIKEIT